MELLKKADAMKEDCGRFVEVTLSNGFWGDVSPINGRNFQNAI